MNHLYFVKLKHNALAILNGVLIGATGTKDNFDSVALYGIVDRLALSLNVTPKNLNIVLPAGFDNASPDESLAYLIESGTVIDPKALQTFELAYTTITHDGFMLQNLLQFQAENERHAIEKLIDSYKGNDECVVFLNGNMGHVNVDKTPALHFVSDNEYTLNPVMGTSVNIYAGNIQIAIKSSSEGVIIDAYQACGQQENLGSMGIEWVEACDE